jgi:hypothetical protein
MPRNGNEGGFDPIGPVSAEQVDALLVEARRLRSQALGRLLAGWGTGLAAAFRALFVEPFAHRYQLPPHLRHRRQPVAAGTPSSGLTPAPVEEELQRACRPKAVDTREFRDDSILGHRASPADDEPQPTAPATGIRKAAA